MHGRPAMAMTTTLLVVTLTALAGQTPQAPARGNRPRRASAGAAGGRAIRSPGSRASTR